MRDAPSGAMPSFAVLFFRRYAILFRDICFYTPLYASRKGRFFNHRTAPEARYPM